MLLLRQLQDAPAVAGPRRSIMAICRRQPRQEPALCNLYRNCLGLCRRVPRSVMARHLRIGSVETGVAAIGVGYGGLEIVALSCPERLCALRVII